MILPAAPQPWVLRSTSNGFGSEFTRARQHFFGTLLNANTEDVTTVRELLKHANIRISLDVYTRTAQSKVIRMRVSNVGTMESVATAVNARKALIAPTSNSDLIVT
ncbi:MAG: hypothetical protein ABI142_11675 [Bryocella sp.]